MFIDLLVACIGGALLGSEDRRDQALGTALVGAAAWWTLRDIKEA